MGLIIIIMGNVLSLSWVNALQILCLVKCKHFILGLGMGVAVIFSVRVELNSLEMIF